MALEENCNQVNSCQLQQSIGEISDVSGSKKSGSVRVRVLIFFSGSVRFEPSIFFSGSSRVGFHMSGFGFS